MTIHNEHPFGTPEGERDTARRLRGRLGGQVSLWTTGTGTERAGLTVSSLMVAVSDKAARRTIIWDSHCSFCHRWARVLAWLDVTGAHRFVGTAEPEAYADPRVTPEDTDRALQLLTPRGRFEGYDAIRRVLLRSPLTFWFAPVLWLPPVRAVGERIYWRVAASRTCAIGAPQPPLTMPWRNVRRRQS